ncbi:MAG: GspH/FimT family pseudopilin [Steroidobacteraceae bacterium]
MSRVIKMLANSCNRGFTLIEMMVALSVAAILLSIAVPSFSQSRLNSQLRASANDLVASINLARSEAIKRSASVTICVSTDGENCTGGNWNQGWVVRSAAGEVLHKEAAAPAGFVIKEAAATSALVFQSTGVDTTPGTFTVCRASPSPGSQERVITVDATGRAALKRTSTGACS